MKIAFIHNEKKIGTGAHYINDLMALKLRSLGLRVNNFYPKSSLMDTPEHMNGIKNILFFYSLLEKRKKILKHDLIQGTTYTVLPFLTEKILTISHFGSTSRGFLQNTPFISSIEGELKKIWHDLKEGRVIKDVNIATRRPMRDIADMEEYVAKKTDFVVATSEKVKNELMFSGVDEKKIRLIHNCIEDYWFDNGRNAFQKDFNLVFLGRLGDDVFTLKLKGIDRLIDVYQSFPEVPKKTICITRNNRLLTWLQKNVVNHSYFSNVLKDNIPQLMNGLKGSVLYLPSRYEGFSLSLIEGMSQGLIPVAYSVGVVPEIIKEGVNGFIVQSQEQAKMKIKELSMDREMRNSIANNAIKTAESFSSNIIIKNLVSLYEEVLYN